MKLFNTYWNYLCAHKREFAETIKDEKDSCFILIVTKYQDSHVKEFISDYRLQDYVQYKLPYYITNGSHDENGRILTIYCLGTAKPKVHQLPQP